MCLLSSEGGIFLLNFCKNSYEFVEPGTKFPRLFICLFRNGYEISGDIVFLSFVLKSLILIIKHNGKVNFHLVNRIIYIYLLYVTFIYITVKFVFFFGKKIWRNALASKSVKIQGVFGEMFVLIFLSSAVLSLQNGISNFF